MPLVLWNVVPGQFRVIGIDETGQVSGGMLVESTQVKRTDVFV